MKKNQNLIIEYIAENPLKSSKEIHEGIGIDIGYATVKRILNKIKEENYVELEGKGRGTKYKISPSYSIIYPIDIEEYFLTEIDNRIINEEFNLELIPTALNEVQLFTVEELDHLNKLQAEYTENLQTLSDSQYHKELERLAIDLSWKSSQIEGNTYSLLETERLLKENLK